MRLNIVSTLSIASATTCLAVALLSSRLGQGEGNRHFRYAAFAALTGAAFCLAHAVLVSDSSPDLAAWAARVSISAACLHGVAWLAFLGEWEQRPLARFEVLGQRAGLFAAVAALIPGVAVAETVTPPIVGWFAVTYREPNLVALGVPIVLTSYGLQVLAARRAWAATRTKRRARSIAGALTLVCLVSILDLLTALKIIPAMFVANLALAFVALAIAAVVASESVEKSSRLVIQSAELESTRAELVERERLAALGQLAAVVAHEVRNPVAVIFGALATLQRSLRSPQDAELLAIVGEEAERLKHLVATLLDAVRPFKLDIRQSTLEDIVMHGVALATSGAGLPASEVTVEPLPDATLACDELLVGQALSNLIGNALVASGRTSKVSVRARREDGLDGWTRIEVTDDGDGVAEMNVPRLFHAFFTTRASGTGLGLSLVKRVAEAHGGTVSYEPMPSRGATFVLRLPARTPARPTGRAA